MRLLISLPLQLYTYVLSFRRYNDVLAEIVFSHRFYPPQSRLKPLQDGFS